MKISDLSRAVAATTEIATRSNLQVDDVSVVHNSNKLALHLAPCEVVARVAHVGQEVAEFEIAIAQALAEFDGCPVASLDPRVEPVVHIHDGFAVTIWTYYPPHESAAVGADAYADSLVRLHRGMQRLAISSPQIGAPHFTDRVAEAEQLVLHPPLTPGLPGDDRRFLIETLDGRRRSLARRGAPEQLLHGEPHPGNVLYTDAGPVFIDLETCCHGPVEFDLAHAPEAIGDLYPNVDRAALDDCRALVLAMVAAWRWDRTDEFPNGRSAGQQLLDALRAGPPWPSLDQLKGE